MDRECKCVHMCVDEVLSWNTEKKRRETFCCIVVRVAGYARVRKSGAAGGWVALVRQRKPAQRELVSALRSGIGMRCHTIVGKQT